MNVLKQDSFNDWWHINTSVGSNCLADTILTNIDKLCKLK